MYGFPYTFIGLANPLGQFAHVCKQAGYIALQCYIFKSFKGTWQRGGFSGVFAEIGTA